MNELWRWVGSVDRESVERAEEALFAGRTLDGRGFDGGVVFDSYPDAVSDCGQRRSGGGGEECDGADGGG